MALSLNQAWLDAMSKDRAEIRWLATLNVATATSFQFLSGKCSSITAPESLASVTPVGREIDMITRAVRTQTMSLELARDGNIESIIKTYGVMGARLVLEIGEASLSEANFETAGTYIVQSPIIYPDRVVLPCANPDDLLKTKVTGRWLGKHPLEIIDDLADKAGVPSALRDSTSFDPTQYGTSISHFNLSRASIIGMADSLTVNTPTPARTLIDQLSRLLDGATATGEDGILRFVRFDSSAASVADWTVDDFGDDINFGPIYENTINKFTVVSHPKSADVPGVAEDIVGDLNHTHEDTNSSGTNYAVVNPAASSTSNIKSESFTSPWLNAHAYLVDNIAASGTGGTFTIIGLEAHSFSGARWPDYPNDSQPATAALSAARPAYLRVDDEVIRCDAATVTAAAGRSVTLVEAAGLDQVQTGTLLRPNPIVVNEVVYTVSARAQLGTSAAAHTGWNGGEVNLIYDVTIQEALATSKLTRHSNGAPVARLRTNLSQFAVEINDLVTLTTPIFLNLYKDSLDTNTKWEVIGKKLNIQAGAPGIEWVLGYATTTGSPAISLTKTTSLQPTNIDSISPLLSSSGEDVGENHIVSGLSSGIAARTNSNISAFADAGGGQVTVTTAAVHYIAENNSVTISGTTSYNGTFTATNIPAAGNTFEITDTWVADDATGTWVDNLAVDIAAGIASNTNARSELTGVAAITTNASKDTYAYWDMATVGIVLRETALGAGQPVTYPAQIPLAKIVTDATAVTGVTDLRPVKAINGERLVDASVGVLEQNTEGDWSGNLVPNGNFGMWTEEDQG